MRVRQSNPFKAISSANEPDPHAPARLRVEHLEEPLGIDVARPRLSWWLPLGAREQRAYRLRTNDWDSGRVDSAQSLLVDFAGPPLISRQQVECAVKVWTDKGESEWSRPVCWEIGLLHPGDWMARWIERYETLAENIRSAWWTEYGNADGSVRRPTQANYARSLAFRLAPDDMREKVAQRLVDLIRAADTHVGTGTFGTALLLPVLADAGRADVAYDLLFQDTPPSWMTMIDRGATTIWEMWDGVDENGKAHFSLNHFSLGSVISFMHTHIAGIRLGRDSPAYRRFRVAPVPGGGLTWVRARLESPYGPIESEWRITSEAQLELRVTVPPGTAAEVRLPDGRVATAEPGRWQFNSPLNGNR